MKRYLSAADNRRFTLIHTAEAVLQIEQGKRANGMQDPGYKTGCWMLVTGYRMLVTGYWMFVDGCRILVDGCRILVAGCWKEIDVGGRRSEACPSA